MARSARPSWLLVSLVPLLACGSGQVEDLAAPGDARLVRLDFGDHTLTVPAAVEDGQLVSGGDIRLGSAAQTPVLAGDLGTTESALSIPRTVNLWPDGVVPYTVSPSHPYLNLIRNGISAWERGTRIRFVPRTTQQDYVKIIDDPGQCYSSLGMVGGAQELSIGGNCTAAHELGHALGAMHEHQRPDRDQHINIFWANIPAGYWTAQMTKYTSSEVADLTPYDSGSVMHYASYESFGKGRLLDLKNGADVSYHWYPDAQDDAAIDRLYQTQMATANPAVVLNANGAPTVVTRGPGGRYWIREKSSPTGSWLPWTLVSDTVFDSKPSAVVDRQGMLHIFGRQGITGYTLSQKKPGKPWTLNQLYGFVQGHMSAALNSNGVVEVFGRGLNNQLEHARLSTAGNWSGWSSLGGFITGDPSAFADANGRLVVFVVGMQRGLWTLRQTSAGGSYASSMVSHGGQWASAMNGTLNKYNELTAFGRAVGRGVWRLHEDSANGALGALAQMGGESAGAPLPLLARDGEMHVFFVGTDHELHHARQLTPGGEYSGFGSLHGNWQGNVGGVVDASGALSVFLCGANNHLYVAVAPDYTPQDLGGDVEPL